MHPHPRLLFYFCFLSLIVSSGCGSGASIAPPPFGKISFTSTPSTVAAEGVSYSYQVAATSSDGSPLSFSLTAAPIGATISENSITWTPTHSESRVANAFTVTAKTSGGASASQSWGVSPSGTINIVSVTTYWTPSGSIDVPAQWLSNLPYPAALVPQSDGSLARLQGSATADGSFSIPNVPTGFYWLQIGPNANYWTSTSDFDNGRDVIGRPLASGSQTTTTFDFSVSGLQPGSQLGDLVTFRSDQQGLGLPLLANVMPGSTTENAIIAIGSNVDWSKISSVYVGQYVHVSTGLFAGFLLGPSQTISNPAFVDGATNSVSPVLASGPSASLNLQVAGSAWSTLSSAVGPGSPSPLYSDYSAFVQPFVTDRLAIPLSPFDVGPDLTLIRPASTTPSIVPTAPFYACALSTQPFNGTPPSFGTPAITSDTSSGVLTYSDPYSPDWPRMFEYCQLTSVSVPRPNSNVSDTFFVSHKQTTVLPQGPVAPILSSVQAPTLNGTSFFQSATLNTTSVNISWSVPAIGQPTAFIVEVFQLTTLPDGATGYLPAGFYATKKTSLAVPFLSLNNTYVFSILASSDANANIETNPFRHKIPFAESGVVSAPFTIQ